MTTPGACPPGRYDVAATVDCVARLTMIYNAYLDCISGQKRVVVRFNERWSEYSKPDAPSLLSVYQTLYNQCPGAQAAGLPNLNPGLKARRGCPARGFSAWPTL